MARLHARLYLFSGGRLGKRWFAGAPVMVLQTVGRRSGELRTAPVLYLRDGDRLVVMAANAGADRVPRWWLNLPAAGVGEAVIGRDRVTVSPRVVVGEERARLWRAFVRMYPQAQEYPAFTDRDLPLVALEPIRV
jgi:deazaflavin-dependent oxidoreductase (nitroreductase family)